VADRVWTILDVLNWTAERFATAGIESPRLDAELLLADALATDRLHLYLDHDRPLGDDELARFRDRVRRRIAREPVAYIVGRREFWSLSFKVTPAVLIPRPDTELLVETAAARLKTHPAPRIVDVGTGSGAIAVALARELPAARVDAVDLSEDALAVARENALALGVAERVAFRRGDLLGEAGAGVYDLVVSNPPYVAPEAYEALMPEVRLYEPKAALVAADGGMAIVRRLVRDAPAALRPGGLLLIEIGFDQADRARALFADRETWEEPVVLKDLAGRDRAVLAVRR
jgi:release factor glutamine methyltransferase